MAMHVSISITVFYNHYCTRKMPKMSKSAVQSLSDSKLAWPRDGGDMRAFAPAPGTGGQADGRPGGDLREEALLLRRPLRPRQQLGRHQHVQGPRVHHLQARIRFTYCAFDGLENNCLI